MPNRNDGANSYRYAFQGQEKDPETGMEAFELRLWDSRIGRWLTTDPAGEFFSPYLGMGNNPISNIDPDGGCVDCDQNAANGSTYTDAAGNNWTKGADGWGADNFSDIGVDLGTVTKSFNLGNWIGEHTYFNLSGEINFGTQVGGEVKALGGKVAALGRKNVNPLLKLGIGFDDKWGFEAVPGGPQWESQQKDALLVLVCASASIY